MWPVHLQTHKDNTETVGHNILGALRVLASDGHATYIYGHIFVVFEPIETTNIPK